MHMYCLEGRGWIALFKGHASGQNDKVQNAVYMNQITETLDRQLSKAMQLNSPRTAFQLFSETNRRAENQTGLTQNEMWEIV